MVNLFPFLLNEPNKPKESSTDNSNAVCNEQKKQYFQLSTRKKITASSPASAQIKEQKQR